MAGLQLPLLSPPDVKLIPHEELVVGETYVFNFPYQGKHPVSVPGIFRSLTDDKISFNIIDNIIGLPANYLITLSRKTTDVYPYIKTSDKSKKKGGKSYRKSKRRKSKRR
jgi:hypothetical protein